MENTNKFVCAERHRSMGGSTSACVDAPNHGGSHSFASPEVFNQVLAARQAGREVGPVEVSRKPTPEDFEILTSDPAKLTEEQKNRVRDLRKGFIYQFEQTKPSVHQPEEIKETRRVRKIER